MAKKKEPTLKPAGLGDLIEKATTALGIDKCEGCEQRRINFNRLFPWLKSNRDFTKEESAFVKRIQSNPVIHSEDLDKLFILYNDVFSSKLEKCACPGLIGKLVERVAAFA